MRDGNHPEDVKLSASDADVYWDRVFAELRRCTLEVSFDFMAVFFSAELDSQSNILL